LAQENEQVCSLVVFHIGSEAWFGYGYEVEEQELYSWCGQMYEFSKIKK